MGGRDGLEVQLRLSQSPSLKKTWSILAITGGPLGTTEKSISKIKNCCLSSPIKQWKPFLESKCFIFHQEQKIGSDDDALDAGKVNITMLLPQILETLAFPTPQWF